MADRTTIQAAFTRNAQLLTARPGIGRKTDITTVRLRDGLTCEIEDGPWRLTADLAPKCGGNGAGPTPGTFGRAALGSCLAICYAMWAAALDVPLTHVEVQVQADSDARGLYGIDETPAGYTDMRYIVCIDSPASHEAIMRVIDTAEAHSPYFDVFTQPHKIIRDVRINATEE